MRTSLTTATFLLAAVAAPALAEEAKTSRHVYRGNDSGTAERLAQPRAVAEPIRVVKTQPLNGERGTSSRTVASSNLGPSQVTARASTYEVEVRQPTESVQPRYVSVPANQDRAAVDNNARLIQDRAAVDNNVRILRASSLEDRVAVDRNARVVRNYAAYQQQGQPQPQPQSDAQPQPDAQPGASFVSVPPQQPSDRIVYGNTYGTYSPDQFERNIKYTQPVSYTVERNYYSPVSYAPSYSHVSYAPAYSCYRPSYSYCAPTYYSCYAPRYYSSHCGPYAGGYGGYSGYVGYRSGGYYGSSHGGFVSYRSGGCGGSRWSFGFRF